MIKTMKYIGLVSAWSVFLLLVACGGGGGGGGGGSHSVAAPAAPVLDIGYSFKSFTFNWSAVSGATYYRLFENPDGVSGFTQVGANIAAPATSVGMEVAVHKHDWANARYLLEACNSGGCTASSTINPLLAGALIGYFKASNTGAFDYFGYSVALSADGNTLAVGAPFEDSNATGVYGDQSNNSASAAGAVYVFARTGSAWSQQAYVKASNTDAQDLFGTSVSLSADGSTLAVGAQGEASRANLVGGDETDNGAAGAGAVYVFLRLIVNLPTVPPAPPPPPIVIWAQQAYVKAFNSQSLDQFGASVALSADGNTLAVGVPGDDSNATGIGGDGTDNSATDAGSVRIFTRSSDVWAPQAYIKASNTDAQDLFGTSVALSADGNTLAVGAVGESSNSNLINGNQSNNSASNAGAVYVYARSGTTWSQQAYVKASNSDSSDHFGESVTLSSDGNTLAAGAWGEASGIAADSTNGIGGGATDNAAGNSGAVYVFTRNGTDWAEKNYVKALMYADTDDYFGQAVALSGDGNTLVVGANGEDSNGTGISSGAMSNNSSDSAGAVYVY